VVITGGAGFIGSWLCDFLITQGASVTCLDDMSTGVMRNVSHLIHRTGFRFVNWDVTKASPKIDKCDLIFHLASHPSPEEYQDHPVETILGNSQGTLNMLEVAKENHAVLLFASSSEVYGDAQVVPTPETYWGNVNPIGPRSCYDEGKRFGEALCMAYHRAYGLDVRIVRIFNTYGPRLRADGLYARALSRFIKQALSGSDLTVYGRGDQTRSFCYITDTVHALLLAATKEEMKAQVVNIGNPHEIPILSLAQTIIRIVGSKSQITYHERPVDDPQRRCPDISRSRALLSWAPSVSLEDGLARVVKWFRAIRSE
jgi:UDP-glucuronate decarboxylase